MQASRLGIEHIPGFCIVPPVYCKRVTRWLPAGERPGMKPVAMPATDGRRVDAASLSAGDTRILSRSAGQRRNRCYIPPYTVGMVGGRGLYQSNNRS
jgi:hypothetical protein